MTKSGGGDSSGEDACGVSGEDHGGKLRGGERAGSESERELGKEIRDWLSRSSVGELKKASKAGLTYFFHTIQVCCPQNQHQGSRTKLYQCFLHSSLTK